MNVREADRPLRVLQIIGGMNAAGAESRLMELYRALDRDQVQFDFLVFHDSVADYEPEILSLGGTVIHIPHKNIVRFAWRLFRLIRKRRYHVVDCSVLYFSGISLMIAKWAKVRKRVFHIHNTEDDRRTTICRSAYRMLMMRLILRYSTDIVGVSKAVLRRWFGEEWRLKPLVCLRYNGLDINPYKCKADPVWLRQEFSIPQNFDVVIHVGRFNRQKNHLKLTEIAIKYIARFPNTCFLLVGDGPLRAKIEEIVRDSTLSSWFRFAGVRSDVPMLLKSVDALLFPSLFEGLPGVIQEAVAAGLPMVTSDLPEIREVLEACESSAEMLNVDVPGEQWVMPLKRAVDTPKHEEWLNQFEDSPFSVKNALNKLIKIYGIH